MEYTRVNAADVAVETVAQAAASAEDQRRSLQADQSAHRFCASLVELAGGEPDPETATAIRHHRRQVKELRATAAAIGKKVADRQPITDWLAVQRQAQIEAVEREHARQTALAALYRHLGESDAAHEAQVTALFLDGIHAHLVPTKHPVKRAAKRATKRPAKKPAKR